MQYKSTIEKNELNELPVETFEGNIHVIDSEEQTKSKHHGDDDRFHGQQAHEQD